MLPSAAEDSSMLALCSSWAQTLRGRSRSSADDAPAGWDSRRVSIARLCGELRITNEFQQALAKEGRAFRDNYDAEFGLFMSSALDQGKSTVSWRELVAFFAPSLAGLLLPSTLSSRAGGA